MFREEATSAFAGCNVGLLSWSNWNLECGGRKTGELRKNPMEQGREPTTNSTHIWNWARIEPEPHWWEASAFTTAPTLLPKSMLEASMGCGGSVIPGVCYWDSETIYLAEHFQMHMTTILCCCSRKYLHSSLEKFHGLDLHPHPWF